jgi:acetylglutamate kinase
MERAQVLTEALPYIKQYNGQIVVVKYGGNAMINEELKQQVMEDICLLWLIGVKVVLIHGGGPEISETMKRLGKKSEFVNGLRVTDRETVDIVQMVLAGKVNKTLVNLLQMKGCLLEGMACPGGCVAGAGTLLPVDLAAKVVGRYQNEADATSPLESPYRDKGHTLD